MARIVVADDEPDIRRLMTFTLRRRGHEVLEAASGEAALELIRRERVDLAVLDMMMPGLTGLEVADALNADEATSALPVLLVSANFAALGAETASSVARRETLAKPFAPQELATRVDALLGSRPEGTPAP